MQRPKLSPLQSRLLAYLVASSACIALWTPSLPLVHAAEVLATPDHDAFDSLALHAFTSEDTPSIEDGGYDRAESDGYEPEFSYLDRSLIGRQTEAPESLTNNEKTEKDIDPEQTIHFVFEKGQLRLRSVLDVPLDALEARGADNVSNEAGLEDAKVPGKKGDIGDDEMGELAKRQAGSSRVWITANTCRQPMPNGDAKEARKNHPQLVMYVSTSPRNKQPGPDATQDTLTNITGVLFDGGYASFELNTTSDVYIGIGAPKLEEDWFGSWHFELAASTDGPYHSYDDETPFLYMVDTDSESTLFITYDMGDSNDTTEVDRWREQNPFHMYAFPDGEWTPVTGLERSYCALKEQFNVNATRNFTIDSSITTKFRKISGDDNMPKTQFHVRNLQTAKTYNGFVVIEGSQQPLTIPGTGTTRGGGRVFQAFNWTTKADDSCQVLFDLEFCDMVAYAVPSNTNFKLNDSALAEIYENKAREYYDSFNKSLAQVACDTVSEAQYSLAVTCDDCARNYKNWLCMVQMPRCEDWTASDSSLVPRNIKTPFANGSLPDMIPGFNDSAAFSRSRNPIIDEDISPGPYKELKPCEDMCFDIVRSCPAQLGFACPNGAQRDSMYGRRDENPDRLTCNFPGAVVKLNAKGGAGMLGVHLPAIATVIVLATAMLWV
ncbi:calcium channel subunit Mid1 [Alternaria rosae]|uniref:calcium channel subunit Mid1 n=1 Tax=Alternaria rosae TaxID=1187941 RepID=UPI001E8DB61A|nr:calcium channel subunit Mid1 [Alternaria rosae]KAH6868857.1 calcium channel subunit Mid1 [Alternaria rosae]